jgi:haloalkane dehalogenase
MHYVDAGPKDAQRSPVVLVHGTPVSSLVYRRFIGRLATDRRVIAVDHLGFGGSDKRPDADYRPSALARHLERFLDEMKLRRPVLVVHDFGGPIGLSYAVQHPDRVRGLVLFNTWMWSLANSPAATLSRIFASPLGRFLYLQLNFSPRVLLPMLFADKSKLTPELKSAYTSAFSKPADRFAPWTFAKELLNSSDLYESLWKQRGNLASVPALLLWGMQDKAFRSDALERWQQALPHARTVSFPDCGHLVQEESPEKAMREIIGFLGTLE